ncbi:MAG TPA: OPT/YSL family transporter, partial [Thermoanaerobaculia bacterium]|nr:OPT/YSL family transporter [Thermoanaerobaculia bacterium]
MLARREVLHQGSALLGRGNAGRGAVDEHREPCTDAYEQLTVLCDGVRCGEQQDCDQGFDRKFVSYNGPPEALGGASMSFTAGQEYPDIIGAQPDVPVSSTFEPYIPSTTRLPELTVIPVIMGTILGAIFGASSLYLVLKVGLTVSASIPVAVISITLFRILSKMGLRDATILENNIVQTAGS